MSVDSRLTAVREVYSVFPKPIFSSKREMETRKEKLKYNLRMAAGLYPWPDRAGLNAKFGDVGCYDGYRVKKIMFESYPGLWSTGNLYLPDPLTAPAPAILNLIGHWNMQRLERRAEEEEQSVDYPQQLANFARMGFVCLVTDMIGMVDSKQLTHTYGKDKENDLWLSNGLGVQLWSNIRAVDLLCSMPEVDKTRIGVTGASGGASQSLFLSFVDERIQAAALINMISTAVMIKQGHVYENLMVNLQPSNIKLRDRMIRITMDITGLNYNSSEELLSSEVEEVSTEDITAELSPLSAGATERAGGTSATHPQKAAARAAINKNATYFFITSSFGIWFSSVFILSYLFFAVNHF